MGRFRVNEQLLLGILTHVAELFYAFVVGMMQMKALEKGNKVEGVISTPL
jgi:hypothetical protein